MELQYFFVHKHRPLPIFKFEFFMCCHFFSAILQFAFIISSQFFQGFIGFLLNSLVCLSMWDDWVKKGVYQIWYHTESVMVCLRIWDDLVGRVCIRILYRPGRAPVTQGIARFRYL